MQRQYLPNMKNFKASAFVLAAVLVCSCADKAYVRGTINGAVGDSIVAAKLDVNTFSILDTLVTDTAGKVELSVDVREGQPEFVYFFRKGTKVASLLLEKGDRVTFDSDTLGNCDVKGSEASVKLLEVEKAFSDFAARMNSTEDEKQISKYYVDYYRWCVKYVIANPYSLTVLPVLYGQLGPYAKVFCNPTDAVYFRAACDSLKTVYPESAYVKALENEAVRRQNALAVRNSIMNAPSVSFPEIEMPDMNGRKVKLSSVDSKAVILHFWSADDAAQKMFVQETLKPLYDRYHSRGLEIYSVCVSPNKVIWADIVKSQNLEWINVNDGNGAVSALVNYNVTSLPASILIENGEICTKPLKGIRSLSDELESLL